MDNKILIICHCSLRGNSIGLIEEFLTQFDSLKKDGCQIDLFDTNFFECHNPSDYKVDNYYYLNLGIVDRIARKIPGLRVKYLHKKILQQLEELLRVGNYDLVVMYSVPPYSDKAVDVAHKYGTKITLFPWGSEVLRAKGEVAEAVKRAHIDADFIAGHEGANLLINARDNYKVEAKRIKARKTFPKGVQILKEIIGKQNRKEMSSDIGIPYAEYNIICGYSGREGHRHKEIIEAIYANKEELPNNYQLVFPVTYACEGKYIEELKSICSEKGLNAVFLTKYMSDEHIAKLHLLTDLYINIQPSDNGNSFMTEALYAGNKIITGRWLNYSQYEKYGIPYYLIDKIEDLTVILNKLFKCELDEVEVPKALKKEYEMPEGYDNGKIWREMLAD